MTERKYLGQIDKTRDYIAICQLVHADEPDEYEVWFNPEAVYLIPRAIDKMQRRIEERSGEHWRVRFEELNIGRIIVRENRDRPESDEYGSDRAISDILAFLLESEKPTRAQKIAEQRISAQALRTAKMTKNAAK